MRESLANKLYDIIVELIDDGVTARDFLNESGLQWQQALENKIKLDIKEFK
jgi:hypothetical protein